MYKIVFGSLGRAEVSPTAETAVESNWNRFVWIEIFYVVKNYWISVIYTLRFVNRTFQFVSTDQLSAVALSALKMWVVTFEWWEHRDVHFPKCFVVDCVIGRVRRAVLSRWEFIKYEKICLFRKCRDHSSLKSLKNLVFQIAFSRMALKT